MIMRRISFQILAFLLISNTAFSAKVEKGFEALRIFDYFKARSIFYSCVKKNDPAACYGLAVIFSRNDNPFSQLDSATKFISLSNNLLTANSPAVNYSGFIIEKNVVQRLCDSVASLQLQRIPYGFTTADIESFMRKNYMAKKEILDEAASMRDELDLKIASDLNSSAASKEFINCHPQSKLVKEADFMLERQLYSENTSSGGPAEYISFLSRFPKSNLRDRALQSLFLNYKNNSDVTGLRSFISNYPNSSQVNEAWKLLFALTVHSFDTTEIEKFLDENPSFPFKNSIQKELTLNKLELLPYETENGSGFIDVQGKIKIPPTYDEVQRFCDGLAVVHRGDSAFYINKENEIAFNSFYSEAYNFEHGISAVKKDKQWCFINRQGQETVCYDEINELSDELYVVKKNGRYSMCDIFGKEISTMKFDKLGDFKNGFAYYSEEGKYGFVSKSGQVFKPEFEWISDFSEFSLAIYRQNNLYGIVNSKGEKVLGAEYDHIVKGSGNIFVLVKNSMYGFFNGSGCFLSAINNDYLKEKNVDFYTDGKNLRLLKKNESAIVDLNGKNIIDGPNYQEVNFASCGLMRLKKKNKYGFAACPAQAGDKKLSMAIPYKFLNATDFTDNVSIVELPDKYAMIDLKGKEIFSSKEKIERVSKGLYLTDEDEKQLVDANGKVIFSNVKSVQKANNQLLIISLGNGEIKLLKN
jgi:hypothetical protein